MTSLALLLAIALAVDAQPGSLAPTQLPTPLYTDPPPPRPPRCTNQDALFGGAINIKTTANDLRRVITVDLDGDGDIDVLTASCGDDAISWFDNEGGSPPGLTEVLVDDAVDCPLEIVTGDIDGDGIKDVAAASVFDNSVTWYKFNGEFPYVFTKNVLTASASGASTVALADLDGDDDLDILYAEQTGNNLGYFANLGNGSFTAYIISSSIEGRTFVRTADVDNDSDIDLLLVSRDTDLVEWYENLGGSPILFRQRRIAVTNGPSEIVGVDFDGDTDLDIVTASRFDSSIFWYESNGGTPPTFSTHLIATTTDPRTLSVVDFDNDGDMDVLTINEFFTTSGADRSEVTLRWYESDSANAFVEHDISTVTYFTGSGSNNPNNFAYVTTGDIDGDANIDVVATFRFNGLVLWHPNICEPFTGPTSVPTSTPSFEPTSPPFPAPTTTPTLEPTPFPTTTKTPTTETPLPSTPPTPAPSGLPNCQDDAVDASLSFCESLKQNCATYSSFCQSFREDFGALVSSDGSQ